MALRSGIDNLMTSATTTGVPASPVALGRIDAVRTFQAHGTTSAGAGAAVILVQVSNNNSDFITLGSITLTLATTSSSDGFTSSAPWPYVRANVSSISGTGAAVSLKMSWIR